MTWEACRRRVSGMKTSSITPMLLLAGLSTSALLLTSCEKDAAAAAAEEVKLPAYPAFHPVVRNVSDVHDYVAEIRSARHIEIGTRVEGFLSKVHVDEGERVEEGQLLFTLSDQEFQAQMKRAEAALLSARADLKSAEIEAANAKSLKEKNIIAHTEYELAAVKVEAARAKIIECEADVQDAKTELAYTEVHAPFAGVISRLPKKAGSLVGEGETLTTLSDDAEVFAYFNVSESEYLDLARHKDKGAAQTISLILADGSKHEQAGKIESWDSVVSPETGSVAFRARFANPQQLLKHGASGKVIVETPVADALVIPQRCTFEVQHKLCVYVVDGAGKVQLRNVQPSLRLDNQFVISSGLQPEDRVLLEGIQSVKEGDIIELEMKPGGEVALR